MYNLRILEAGQTGRDGLPARGDIYCNLCDISKACKNVTELMRNYIQPKECKRKIYFDFDHDVPINQHPDHTCSDLYREHSQ